LKYLRIGVVLAACSAAACSSNSNGPSSTVQPIPNYAGTWDGVYSVTSCSQTGEIAQADLCSVATVGTVLPHRFEFTQSGRDISGQFYLGGILFSFNPVAIATDGSAVVRGTGGDNTVKIIATWTLHLSSGTPIGTVAQSWTATDVTGEININGSTTTGTKAASLGPTLAQPATLRGFAEALREP
jgi:hypothetical protein